MLYGGSIKPGPLQGRRGDDPAGVRGRRRVRRRQDHRGRSCTSWRRRPRRAPAPAAGSSPPTRWRWRSRRSGISPAGSAMVPAEDGRKLDVARSCGELVMDVLRRGQRPSDIITKPALENAIAAVATSGGSTNGVLHLLAVAREIGVPLEIDEFEADLRAHAAALRPAARRAVRRHRALRSGRRAARARAPARRRHPERRRADGHRADDRRARRRGAARPTASASCARSSDPLKPTGGFAILRGNVAPDGCVVKLSGHERRKHVGPARVFDGEEAAMAAVLAHEIQAGDVVVIRGEGPAGGPGMREMLAVTARDRRRGPRRGGRADHRRALLRRNARLHGRPRRARGGRAAARSRRIADGDQLTIDVDARRLDVALSDEQIAERVAAYAPAAARGRAHRRGDPEVRQARRQRRRGRRRRAERSGLRARKSVEQRVERRRALEHRHVAGVLEDDLARVRDQLGEHVRVADA